MQIHWHTALAIVVAFAFGIFHLRATWPVGWFDLVVTAVLSVLVGFYVRYFKGFKTDNKSE